jgi:hypothetical protein
MTRVLFDAVEMVEQASDLQAARIAYVKKDV